MTAEVVECDGHTVKVIRTSRRTLALEFRRGVFTARCPKNLSKSELDRFIASKRGWILKHAEHSPKVTYFDLQDGQTLAILGRPLRIQFDNNRRGAGRIDGGNNRIILPTQGCRDPQRAARVKLDAVLKEQLSQTLLQLVSTQLKVLNQVVRERRSPNRTWFDKKRPPLPDIPHIVVKAYKRRWGSCDAQHALSFNIRLAFAPPAIVEYVAAHEVAHMVEFNHSSAFWTIVEALNPDYRQHREWLKREGATLYELR